DCQGNSHFQGIRAARALPANGFQSRPGGANLYRLRGSHVWPLSPPGASAISAIAADPSHPGHLYAAFSSAVWKSTDGGETWKRLEADWPQSLCNTIAVAPSDSATIYVLCGVIPAPGPPSLFRSTDAGLTWTRRTAYVHWYGGVLLTLEVAPHNASSLWSVGFNPQPGPEPLWDFAGLHSTDGGATWTPIDPMLFGYTFFRFAFDNRRPGIMYATAW